MRRNYFSRMMAASLSLVIALSNTNMMVLAGEDDIVAAKTITSFEILSDDIEYQKLFVGADFDEIIFPKSLNATATYIEEKKIKKIVPSSGIPAQGKPDEGTSEQDQLSPDAKPQNPLPQGQPDPNAPDRETSPKETPVQENPVQENPIQETPDQSLPPQGPPSQDPPIQDPPPQDPPVENPPTQTPPTEQPQPPTEEEPQPENTETSSLIGRLFPALKVYAASTTLGDVVESNENKKQEYEIVKEVVTVTDEITLNGIVWKLDKENSSFDEFRSDEAGAKFIFVPVISGEYEIKAELPRITVDIAEPFFLRTMLHTVSASDYAVEHADGKTFTQTVRVNFKDASLLTADESYVELRLVGNISGKKVRKGNLAITSEPFTVLESGQIKINGIAEDGEGNTSAYIEYTFSNVPVYINKGTGDAMAGGSGTYDVPAGFYGIQITTADGYSVAKGTIGSNSYHSITLEKDVNDAAWNTNKITIENEMLQLAKPYFSVEWLDNRNYSALRPFTTGISIDDKINEIKQSIELYYKDGADYVLVSDTSPVLVSPDSNHPDVEGGPFYWKISYKNLPRYQTGDTPYQWFVKLTDDFYDGKKANYIARGLNEDGYLGITDSGNDKVTLVFSDAVTGSILWRIGKEDITTLPPLPETGLLTTSENTMRIFSKKGENPAVEVLGDNFDVEWAGNADGTIWNYTIKGLPNYTDTGDAIIYYTVIDSTANSQYKFSYDNGKDSTETDKCLSGQKIYATLIGKGQFSFDKVWYDDKDEDSIERRKNAITKGITFYLWRYPSNKNLSDGAPVTNNAKQYSYTVPLEKAQQDSFSISLADFAGSDSVSFPKYDELGFEYIYYATEVSKSELYKIVYWNGPQDEFTGESNDKCVFDGGSICNVRSSMIAPSVTKQWSVSAISDYVGSTCDFILQRKEKGVWTNVENLALSGFSSSKKKVSGAFNAQQLYDPLGRKYEYRVIEANVRSGSGKNSEFEQEDWQESADGKFSRVYTLNDYTYKSVSDYVSTVDNGVETAEALITNKLFGTKKLTVIKTWYGTWGIGTTDDKSGNIEISLKRDNEKYATIIFNKPADGENTGSVTVRYEEDGLSENYDYQVTGEGSRWVWTSDEITVPAYTEEGRQYAYSIVEEKVEVSQDVSFYQEYDRNITGKTIKLYVTNRIGTTSTDTMIKVEKIWKDDSDSSQRSNVKIEFGYYDENNIFVPVKNSKGEPYVLILTPERDYNYYTWVNGELFKEAGSNETGKEAIKNRLSIKASLYNSLTNSYDREMENCSFSQGSITGGIISPIVDKSNSFYRPGYSVSIEKNADGTSFTITNTRIANRAFSFTKKWEDSSNVLGLRKDFLRVALFRETGGVDKEIAYIDIPTNNNEKEHTVTFTKNGDYYPAYDEDGNNYIYSVKEYICTGTPSAGEISFDDGVEPDSQGIDKKEVSVTATKETTTTGYVVTAETGSTEYDHDSNTNTMLMTERYTYTNMAAGERAEVPFYVIWHDNAKSNERPDIYLTLYYDGGENGELIRYQGAYTERWENVETDNKYIQKAIFGGLPSADPNGRVYNYYVTETFNNNTTSYGTEHYVTPLRNSTDTDYNLDAVKPIWIGTDHQLKVKPALADEKDTVSDYGHYFFKEGSFVLITISDAIKVEGRKLWLGIPDGIDVDKLPLAHIYLFRKSAYDNSNMAPEVAVSASKDDKMTAYSRSCVGEISDGDGSESPQKLNTTKSMYIFGTYNSDGSVKSYADFPKYDDMGYLYTYSVREVIYNTLKDENQIPADIMIPNYSDNSADLSNQYKLDVNKNQRQFVISKQWDIEKSKFQDVDAKATFRIYRLELESDGHGYTPLNAQDDENEADPASSAAAAKLFVSLTNDKLEFLDEKTIGPDVTKITWNYPIYAPSGKLYAYYAVELTADMPGYQVSLNGANSADTTPEGSGAEDGNTMISGDGYIGVAFANSGLSLTNTSENNQKIETFRNTYRPTGFKTITFTKKWNAKDSGNNLIEDMIPGIDDAVPALKFDVYAIASTQSGKGNPDRITIPEEDYDVSVSAAAGDISTWNYTITLKDPLVAPIYSANGNLYTYYVKEVLNSGFVKANYKGVSSIRSARANTAQGTVLNIQNPLENTLKGSFEVLKIWDDFSNDYGMREGSITFDVYYRLGDNGVWTKYRDAAYTISSGNKWKLSISNLPVSSNDSGNIGEYYQYRVWEKEINAADGVITVGEPSEDDAQDTKWEKNNTQITDVDNYFTPKRAGNYKVYNPSVMKSIASSPSKKIVNQLDTNDAVVSLKVTKKWNDEDNKYKLRPNSIKVTIQSSKDGGANWANVTVREITGEQAVTGDSNTWEKTFDNLPKFYSNNTESRYMYRAIETKIGNTTVALTGSTGTCGSYEIEHEFGTSDSGYTSVITNTMIRKDVPIHVKKYWNKDEPLPDVEVALYSTNYTGGTIATGTPVIITFLGNKQSLSASNNWEYTYSGLPKFNMDGAAINYYVKEITTGNYKTQYLPETANGATGSGDDVTIVNTPYTDAYVEKIWSDNDNIFGTRPENAYVRLQRKTVDEDTWSNVAGQQVIALNEDNNWKSTIEQLPLYKDYSEEGIFRYEYRFIETDSAGNPFVPPCYSLVSDSSDNKTVITNTLITKTVTVTKHWDDDRDSHKIRPSEITIYLDEEGDYVRYDGNRCSNISMSVTPRKSSDGSTWTYVFEGLPKYEYGSGAAAEPREIIYKATEDVDKTYTGGFVIKNYYATSIEESGDEISITNTALENDGVLIIGKSVGSSDQTNYAFPLTVTFTRPDGVKVDFEGDYYLYDAAISNEELRQDALNDDSTTERLKIKATKGVVRIPAGRVAVITGINTMYQYTITESPGNLGYSVDNITGADEKEVGVLDARSGGYIGIARGHIPGLDSTAVRVVFTNKLLRYDTDHKYLKVENITRADIGSDGRGLTGGQVKVYQSNKVIDSSNKIGQGSYEYVDDETPYVERAMSVEFAPDQINGYSYADTLTINWWQNGEDTNEAALHRIEISGYFYTDSSGRQRPYTGKLIKDGSGNITSESEFEQFETVWKPLLEGDDSPFKYLTVLEGSVVVTLASSADDMPLKTLVQVEFVKLSTSSSNGSESGEGDGSGGIDTASSDNSGSDSETAENASQSASGEQDQASKDGNLIGVRTGDDTPLNTLVVLFIFFALGFAIVFGKYLKNKSDKK